MHLVAFPKEVWFQFDFIWDGYGVLTLHHRCHLGIELDLLWIINWLIKARSLLLVVEAYEVWLFALWLASLLADLQIDLLWRGLVLLICLLVIGIAVNALAAQEIVPPKTILHNGLGVTLNFHVLLYYLLSYGIFRAGMSIWLTSRSLIEGWPCSILRWKVMREEVCCRIILRVFILWDHWYWSISINLIVVRAYLELMRKLFVGEHHARSVTFSIWTHHT